MNKDESPDTEYRALIARFRAGVKFIGPQEITPMGARILEKILEDAESKLPLADSSE